MGEKAKQYVHPIREKAEKELDLIVNFINIRNAGGWNLPEDLTHGLTLIYMGHIHTTRQLLTDTERLQRQIDDLKEEIGQLKAARDKGADVAVHVIPAEERKPNVE
jgi:hypothetical protein